MFKPNSGDRDGPPVSVLCPKSFYCSGGSSVKVPITAARNARENAPMLDHLRRAGQDLE